VHGGNSVTCENCHGPGKAHVDGRGETSKIFNPAKASAKDVSAKCLACHGGAHPDFEQSAHGTADVSCIGCHEIHQGAQEAALLKAPQPMLCFQCHEDVKPQFSLPFHHKVNEGQVSCTDCHDAHGAAGRNNLKSTAGQNAVCARCHREARGPFVFEHAVVHTEGCVGCHTPHGSENARLLQMGNIASLCGQCHSPVVEGTVHRDTSPNSAPCTSCHTMIHGSNRNQAFIG
jgi:DmsE family decaheme c-type cytochrome